MWASYAHIVASILFALLTFVSSSDIQPQSTSLSDETRLTRGKSALLHSRTTAIDRCAKHVVKYPTTMFSSSLLVPFCAITVILFFGNKIVRYVQFQNAQKSRGCLSPKKFRHYEPLLGLDLLFSMAKALKQHRFLDWQKEFFAAQNAKTFEATLLGSRMVYSSESENMKAMSTSVEQDFGVEPIRNGNGAVTPFTSHGTSTSDGEIWKFSRNLIKPYFDREGYRDLGRLEVHVDKLLELVPTDKSTFDLQPLLQRWVKSPVSDMV